MPPGGGESRAEALATLRVFLHELADRPALADLFAAAEGEQAQGALGPWEAANLREMRRGYLRETALPGELVQRSSLAESRCEQAWRSLRPRNDWAGMLPLLEEVVAAQARGGGGARRAAAAGALRRAARRLRAGGPQRRHRRAVRRAARLPARASSPGAVERQRREAVVTPARALPDRAPALAGPGDREAGRLRLRPRPARRQPPPVLRRRPARRAHHHPLRRGGLHQVVHGGAARDRPRQIRAEPAGRLAGSAGRAGAQHGPAREPEPAAGDAGQPQPRLPGVRRPPRARGLPRGRRRARPTAFTAENLLPPLHARAPRLHPGGGRRGDLPLPRLAPLRPRAAR